MTLKLKIMDILRTVPLEVAGLPREGNGLKNADHIADKILATFDDHLKQQYIQRSNNMAADFMKMMEKTYNVRFIDS